MRSQKVYALALEPIGGLRGTDRALAHPCVAMLLLAALETDSYLLHPSTRDLEGGHRLTGDPCHLGIDREHAQVGTPRDTHAGHGTPRRGQVIRPIRGQAVRVAVVRPGPH